MTQVVGTHSLRLNVFTFDEKQQRAADFFVRHSREAAESFFTAELREGVTGLYPVAPGIEFAETAGIAGTSRS